MLLVPILCHAVPRGRRDPFLSTVPAPGSGSVTVKALARIPRMRWLLMVLLLATLVGTSPPASPSVAQAQEVAPGSTLPPVPSPASTTTTMQRRGRTVQVRAADRQPAPDGRPMAPGRLIVKFRPGAGTPNRDGAHRAAGAVAAEPLALPNTALVQVAPNAVDRALAAYRARPDVASVQPDYVRRATELPNDPSIGSQYGVGRINAPAAWDRSKSDPSVRIAILDTGVFSRSSTWEGPDGFGHRDVRDKILAEHNFTDSDYGADDIYDHGTMMAGIAAAATNNDVGVAGIGYNATLLNGKVLGDDGSGYDSDILEGIVWAADHGAKVISMSLGVPGPCTPLYQEAIDYAWSKGAVVVAAAGNGGNDGIGDPQAETPASCERVLAVAATDQNDVRAGFSNFGTGVDLAAPGVGILSTDFEGRYSTVNGTSPATPHVAGVAALVWATQYGTSPQGVLYGADPRLIVDRLTSTAARIDGTGSLWTYGRLDAAAAVGATGPTQADPPIPTPTPSPTPTLVPTPSPTPVVACSPRPRVDVTSGAANGALTVTIGATGTGNTIRSVRLGTATRPPVNAVVDVAGGPTVARGALEYAPNPPVSQLRLTIRRATPGQATTVPIVVTDACGTWETVVGGGVSAGF